jgi:hypothetical protein
LTEWICGERRQLFNQCIGLFVPATFVVLLRFLFGLLIVLLVNDFFFVRRGTFGRGTSERWFHGIHFGRPAFVAFLSVGFLLSLDVLYCLIECGHFVRCERSKASFWESSQL